MRFIETSAKNNINITKAFTMLAKEAKRNLDSSLTGSQEIPQKSPSISLVPVDGNAKPAVEDNCC